MAIAPMIVDFMMISQIPSILPAPAVVVKEVILGVPWAEMALDQTVTMMNLTILIMMIIATTTVEIETVIIMEMMNILAGIEEVTIEILNLVSTVAIQIKILVVQLIITLVTEVH